VRTRLAATAALVALALAGCSATPADGAVFPAGAVADYQLGGAYDAPAEVEVVVRDAMAEPDPARYSVCYVNGFQTQPGVDWPVDLLVQEGGEAVVDPDWPDENILDISTDGKRTRILERMSSTVDDCAAIGFAAVEFDNLDTFARFDEHLTREAAVAYATGLADLAHGAGLAAGQKNTPDLGTAGRDDIGFDFAVAEECDRFQECAAYTDVYGDAVIAVEYTDDLRRDFAEICADPDRPESMILRDRDLVPAGDEGYVYEHC
jgi:hypothetical protein